MKIDAQKIIRAFLAITLFIFPLFLLYVALERFYGLVQEDREHAELLRAEKNLSQLRRLANGKDYFAQIFTKTFSRSSKEKFDLNKFKNLIENLKKRFPRSLEFVVWKESGKLCKELSDSRDFVFIKNSLNKFLAQLQKIAHKSFPQTPLLPKNLSRQIRTFRSLLGPFIPAGKIAESFSSGDKGGCFQLHGKGRRAYAWYHKYNDFSVLIFLSHKAVHSFENVKMLCKRMSRLEKHHNYYLIDEKNLKIFPRAPASIETQIRINLQKRQAISPPESLRNAEMLFAYQKLSGKLWAVATIPLSQVNEVGRFAAIIVFRLLGSLPIGAFVFYCFCLVHENPFKSVRYKLLAVFFYAVALPIMIFATIATSYLNEKEARIEVEYGYRGFQMLNRFDQQFKGFISERARLLTRDIDRQFWEKSVSGGQENSRQRVALAVKELYKPFAVLIMNEKGDNVIDRNLSEQISDQSIFKAVSRDLLKYLNRRLNDPITHSQPITKNSILAFSPANKNIRPFNLASRKILYYLYAIKNPTNGRFEYCINLMWDPIEMLSRFFEEKRLEMQKFSRHRWVMYFNESGEKIGNDINDPSFDKLLQRSKANGLQIDKMDAGPHKLWLAVAFNGQNLLDSVICVLIDTALIKQEIAAHKKSLAVLLLFILFFSYSLFTLLNFQILEPIKTLSQGVDWVKNLKYSNRIDLPAENEFGSLACSINAALENLEELAVARVVQEALLPEKSPEFPGLEVAAQTMPMTSLGGDYYDFFIDSEGNLLFIIADIAGHGIQAALVMAMAKSVLLLGKNESWKSEELMKKLNQTFCQLREAGIRTMATVAILEFARNTNNFRFFNAGHCAPAIVNSGQINFLSSASFPLGYRKNRDFKGEEFELTPDSLLVLYTDGIIESRNRSGKMLGQKGFVKMLETCSTAKIEICLGNLMQFYEQWRNEQDDDISFVLIKRSGDA